MLQHSEGVDNLRKQADMDEATKFCTTCKTSKPLGDFYRDKSKSQGRTSRCKECARAYNRQNYLDNRQAVLARTGAYQRADRERSRNYSRKHYSENREYRRQCAAQYRAANPERTAAQAKAYRARHPDKHRRDAHARRAMLARVKHDPAVTLESLRERDGECCCYCGVMLDFDAQQYASNRATVEHITPISRGGDHTFQNTAVACRRCNISKRDSLFIFEWVAYRN